MHEVGDDGAYDCDCNAWALFRDAVGSFSKKSHSPLEQYITWTKTTQCPTAHTHMTHCMHEDQTYNEPVVKDSLYTLISELLWPAKGQTLANSNPQDKGLWTIICNSMTYMKHTVNKYEF